MRCITIRLIAPEESTLLFKYKLSAFCDNQRIEKIRPKEIIVYSQKKNFFLKMRLLIKGIKKNIITAVLWNSIAINIQKKYTLFLGFFSNEAKAIHTKPTATPRRV